MILAYFPRQFTGEQPPRGDNHQLVPLVVRNTTIPVASGIPNGISSGELNKNV